MDIHIQFGWWLVPFVISLAATGWARFKMKAHDKTVAHRGLGDALVDLTFVVPAAFVVLVVWLVYFVTLAVVQ